MRRITSLVLAISMLLSMPVSTYAGNTGNKQPTSTYGEAMLEYLKTDSHKLLVARENYGYMQFADNFRQNVGSLYLLEMVDMLIGTGTEPNQQKYMEVLINIMGTYDLDNATDISEQNSRDNLKSLEDYAMDFVEMGANTVSVMVGNNPAASEFENSISTAIDRISVLKDNTNNWIGALSDLETIVQNYNKHDSFLELIEENAEGDLKAAASTLRTGMEKAFQIKLDTYADITDKNFENYSELFFEDIFWKALKETAEYESDQSLKAFVDSGDDLVANLDLLESSWELGLGIGKLVGNVTVGGEDLINRTLELLALHDISSIVQLEVSELGVQFLEEIGTEKEADIVDEYSALAQYLIGCRIRGEYCLYSIIANDAGLLSWFNKESAEDAKMWYEYKTGKILDIQESLSEIYQQELVNGANIIEKADSQKEPVLDSYEESLKNILSESISEPILNFICDDFDNNGVYEGIAFCGECSSEDGSYFGTLYFVTKNGVEVIREKDGYWNSGVVYDFGDEKIIGITKYFTTGGLSYYYEIDEMTFKELEGSGYGEGFQDEDGKMYMTDSQHDAEVDGTGHTWNLYYFYWEDGLKEYGGIEISEEQFLEYDGAETILEKILKDGYEITSIYKRQNNIININCSDESDNRNVRILLKDKCVQSFPIDEKGFYESGIIKPALILSIATYENENNKTLDEVIENSRECYYEIENQQNSYTVEEEVNYVRYISNGIMRKIVLYPNESELRDMTETYYYDENRKLVFAFVYDAQNEFRYYFHEGLIYRYIDNKGNVHDYKTGKEPYDVEDAGEIYSSGELEKHYYYGG